MKKFMIFLLTTFLFVGVCQARNEATCSNPAETALPDWGGVVSRPMFSCDAKEVMATFPYGAEMFAKLTPVDVQTVGQYGSAQKRVYKAAFSFDTTLSTGMVLTSNPVVNSISWFINGHQIELDSSKQEELVMDSVPVGEYWIKCVYHVTYQVTDTSADPDVVTDLSADVESNRCLYKVSAAPIVHIEGPDHICMHDCVKLTAIVENDDIGHDIKWLCDGNYDTTHCDAGDAHFLWVCGDSLPSDTSVFMFQAECTRDGCEKILSPVFYFTVISTPVIVIEEPMKLCPNGTVTLTAHAYANGDVHPWKWVWHNPDGTLDTTYVNYNDVDAIGKYCVEAIFQNINCNSVSDTVEVENYTGPNGSVFDIKDLTINASYDSVCRGGQVILTLTDPNKDSISGPRTYTWYMDGVLIEGVTDTMYSLNINEDGVHVFTAIASYDNYPCGVATAPAKEVKVLPEPAVIIETNPFVCLEDSDNVVLIGHVLHATDADYVLSWYEEGRPLTTAEAKIMGVHNDTVVLTRKYRYNEYRFSVELATNNGCTATAEAVVSVDTVPVVRVAALPAVICEGGFVTLGATLNDWNAENLMFQWYKQLNSETAVPIPGATTPIWIDNYMLEANNTYTYSLAVTQTNTACVARSNPAPVRVIAQPVIEEITVLPDTVVCNGAQITLTARRNAGAMPDFEGYVWLRNGKVIEDALTKSFSENVFTPDGQTTEYEYRAEVVITAPGCISRLSAPKKITVQPGPTVVSITGNNIICEDDSTTLKVYSDVTTDREITWSTGSTDSSIRVPAGIYTVTVKTTSGNCEKTSEPFEVHALGVDIPVVASKTHICAGEHVTLSVNAEGWEGNISYLWDDESNSTASSVDVAPEITTTYHVVATVTSTNGTCSDTAEITIVVTPLPETVNISVVGDSVICEEQQASLHADGDAASYLWYQNGVVIPGENLADITVNFPDSGTYRFNAKAVNEEGCVSDTVSNTVTITVHHTPIVTIDGNPNVCYFDEGTDKNVELIAWVDGVWNDQCEYDWYQSGQLRSSQSGPSRLRYRERWEPTYDNPLVFTVKVTTPYGCVSYGEPFEVNVYHVPNFNVTGDADEICSGGQVTLQGNLENYNEPMLAYQWYANNTNESSEIEGATHISQTFEPVATTDYILRVTHNMSYKGSCYAYDTFHVTVNDIPQIDSVTNDLPQSKTLCDGRSVTMKAHISKGITGGEVFTWYRNGEVIENATQAIYTETPHAINGYSTKYVYMVSVAQSASGCQSEVYLMADTVTVNPNPTLAIEYDPIVCTNADENVTLIAHVDPVPKTEYRFVWYEDNAIIPGAIGVHGDTIILHRDYRDYAYNFSVELVNNYGCTATATATVLVDSTPEVTITATETKICEGGEITLKADLDNWNLNELEYKWYDNDELIPGATSLTYTVVPDKGEHTYTFTVDQLTSECRAESKEAIVVNVTEIPEIESITTDLPDSKKLCDGRAVTLTAHVSGGVTGGEIYTWYRNGQIIEGATSETYSETPHAINNYPTVYTYTVSVVQTAAGCESAVYDTPVELTVNPNPTLAIEYDPIVCSAKGDNVMLVAHVHPAPTTQYSFNWLEDNNSPIVGVNVIGSVHSDTIAFHKDYRDYPYNFTVELVNNYGCTATATATVLVDSTPEVTITATETKICEGGEITLKADLDNWNLNELEYKWYDNEELIPGATSLAYTVVPKTGEHIYTFTVDQLTSGCHAESNELTVNVYPDPVIKEVTLSDTNVCQGAQIEITAHLEDDYQLGEVYTWYRNGVLMEGATEHTIYDSPVTVDNNTQQFVYTAVVTRTAAGCQSLAVSSAPLVVYPNPTVVISGDQYVCETDSVFLIANVDTIGTTVGTLHYTWYESGQIRDNMYYEVGDAQYYSEKWIPKAEPYRFTVTVEREGVPAACAATSAEYWVYVFPQPVVNVTASETDICTDGEVTLTAHLDDYNATNMTYQWYEVKDSTKIVAVEYSVDSAGYEYETVTVYYNENIPGATERTYTTTYDHTATMGVLVRQTHSTCFDTDEITINVKEKPAKPEIEVTNSVICDGGQVTLEVTNTYDDYGTPTFTWFRNGQLIEGADKKIFIESPEAVDGDSTVYKYTVSVTFDAAGCNTVFSDEAEVTVIPTPVVEVSVEGSTTICEGGNVTLHANVIPATVGYSYQWYKDNVIMTDATDATLEIKDAVARETAYEYKVVVTANPGCQVTSENVAITVVADPLVEAFVDQPVICQGGTVTFTVEVNGGVAGVNGMNDYEFAWYSDLSPDVAIATTPSYTTDDSVAVGIYSYWVKVTSTYGCETTSNIVRYEVKADPEVTITVAEGEPDTVCDGGTTTLIANVRGGFGETSYQWYKNNAPISGATNRTLKTDAINLGQQAAYTVIVTQTGVACAGVSDAFNVNVVPGYSVDITGNMNTCPGGTVTMTATVTGGVSGDVPTYQWYLISGNGVSTPILNANSKEYTTDSLLLGGSYEYYLEVTSSISGCSAISGSLRANVIPEPTVTIEGAHQVCEGGDLTLNAFVNGGVDGEAYTYTWEWTGAGSGTATTTEPKYVPTNLAVNDAATPYLFTVTISRNDQTGCNATSEPFEVNIYATPDVTVTADHPYVCVGGNITFTANVAPVGTYNYEWKVNGNEVAANEPAIVTTAEATGAVSAEVTVSAAYQSVSCKSTATIAVPVNVVADPVVTIQANHTEMCVGGLTTLSIVTNTADANIPSEYSYQWALNGFEIDGAIHSTFNQRLMDAGTSDYTLRVTQNAELGCVSEWSDKVTVQVAEQPVVVINSEDGMAICKGGSVTLTGTIANFDLVVNGVTNSSIYGPITYEWKRGANSTQVHTDMTAGQDQITDVLDAIANYEYSVRVIPAGYNCQPATSEKLTVEVVNAPSWTDVVVGNLDHPDSNVCIGSAVDLTARIQGGVQDAVGNTNGQIQWTVEHNGQTSNVSGGLGGHSFDLPSAAGEYTYRPTYVGNIGSGCAFTNSEEYTVTVHPLPTAEFTGGDGTTLCANVSEESAELTVTFTGTPPFTFEVQDMVSTDIIEHVSYANTYSFYVKPDRNTSYIIISLADAYCSNGEVGASVDVNVNNIRFANSEFTIGCANNGTVTIDFEIISGNHDADFTLTYEDGTTYTGNIVNNTATFPAPPAPGDYDAVFTVGGCNYPVRIRLVNDIELEETLYTAGCGDNEVTINLTMESGNPASEFTVTYDDGTVHTGNIVNNTATFPAPDEPGDHDAIFDVNGCQHNFIVRKLVEAYDFTDAYPIVDQRWNDVVVVNNNIETNGGHNFVSYQWYKDGVKIPGATGQYYQDPNGLNGMYSVELVENVNGSDVTYVTCPFEFNAVSSVRAYPVPANVRQEITLELNLLPEELNGAILDIFDVTGSLISHVEDLTPITKVSGFKAQGTYFGRILTGTNEIKTVKFIIVK